MWAYTCTEITYYPSKNLSFVRLFLLKIHLKNYNLNVVNKTKFFIFKLNELFGHLVSVCLGLPSSLNIYLELNIYLYNLVLRLKKAVKMLKTQKNAWLDLL